MDQFLLCRKRLVFIWAFLVAIAMLQASRPAEAGYWRPNAIGTSCYAEFQGDVYPGDMGAGIQAAFDLHQCLFPTETDPECWVNSFNQAWCEHAPAAGASASYTCTEEDMRQDNQLCSPPPKKYCLICGILHLVGNPVAVASGQKIEMTEDWTSGGPNPMVLSRYYSSQTALFTASTASTSFDYTRLGQGWRTNFDSLASYVLPSGALRPELAGTNDLVHVVMPDHTQYSFCKAAGGAWTHVMPVPATGVGALSWQTRTDIDVALTISASGITLRTPNGSQYEFDNAGLLKKITALGGYSQVLEYFGKQNTRVSDSFGRVMTFEFESNPQRYGLVKTVNLPDGKKIEFTYESRLQGSSASVEHTEYALKSVIYPDETPANGADNPRLTYSYLASSEFPYALTGITDERGVAHGAWTYDSKGRAITSQHDGGADLTTLAYDDANNKVTVTGPLGFQRVYQYQSVNSVLLKANSYQVAGTANYAAGTTSHSYDANNFLNEQTDAEGRITKWTKNSRGLPTSTTEAFGTPDARTTTTSWDTVKPLPTQIVAPRLTTDITYDTAGNVTQMTLTDTTSHTVPYATNGQTRTTAYGYTTFTSPAPPPIAPSGTALSDVTLTVTNPGASSGTTGWTNTTGTLAVHTTGACAGNPCFDGGSNVQTIAHQNIAIPAANTSEVDAGRRALKFAWKQNSYQDTDQAAIRVQFLNASNTVIGSSFGAWRSYPEWTNRERTVPVPALTRTIRVQMLMQRSDGTNNDGYIDDIALTLVADGTAADKPFLTVANSDAAGGNITGWTLASGTVAALTTTPCTNLRCFKDGTTGTDSFYQDLSIPADRNIEVDAGARAVELSWVDRKSSASALISAKLQFLNASNVEIAGTAVASPGNASTGNWRDQTLQANVPVGTRKIRVNFTVTHMANHAVADLTYFSGISARLIGRPAPVGPIQLLTSVNGPLAGAGDTVTYAYDTQGRLATVTNEMGHVTQVTAWNAAGLPTSVSDPNGVVTTMAYDARNRLTTVTVNPGANQAVTTTEYDAAGQVTKVTAPDGSYLQYTYNNARRLTVVTNNTGEKIEYGYNANGDVTSTTVKSSGGTIVRQQSTMFDELGRLMRSIGAASQTTDYDYDRTDNLTQVTDPRSNLFSYAYDALQRLIRTTDQVSAQVNLTRNAQDQVTAYSDPRGLVTTYVHNGFGETIQEQGPDVGTTVITRDARGLTTQVTDPRGVVINLAYDNASRHLSETYPSNTSQNVTYGYDATAGGNKGVGRLTGITDGSGSTSRLYDALGRVTSETRVIAGKNYTTSYGYNAADRLTTITYPSGRIVTYARNSLGQVTGVVTQKDAGSAFETIASGMTWKPMSNLLGGYTYGNGLVASASYDLDYRLTAMTLKDGAADVISLGYAYTDGINLTAINDNVAAGNTVSLAYTAANRLGTAAGPWGSTTYSYDGVGNRLSETTGATSKVTNLALTSNQMTSVVTNGTTTRTFTHDAAGNITVDQKGSDTYTTTYNVRNRPTQVVRTGTASETSTYAYNALEQLVTRSSTAPGVPAGTVHYIYDLDGHLIAEADGATGQTLREYIWLASNDNEPVDLPLGLVTGVNTATPVTTLVHADHLGRPIRMTNAARATVWQASYTPFGEPQTISGSIEQNLRFPGQFFLIETSLAYNWHRHYDPSTGRYTQPDPLRFVDGPSVYAYVGGSPFMHSDRAGLFDKGFADGGTTWGHSDFPGSSSIGGSGHGPFDYNREDTDPATEPYNWPEGTARHFRELPAIEADMRTAIMICNILWFERLMHQGQDYFVHARNGYGAWFGHLYAGHGPDHDDSAWAEAALWSYVWWQRWVNRCDCK